jgi:hypothetical protein
MRRRNIALVAIPFLLLTSCSIYNHFVERGVCQQFKDGNHFILGGNPDIDPVEFFGNDSGMNLAEIVQTKCAKYIELP